MKCQFFGANPLLEQFFGRDELYGAFGRDIDRLECFGIVSFLRFADARVEAAESGEDDFFPTAHGFAQSLDELFHGALGFLSLSERRGEGFDQVGFVHFFRLR